MQFRIPGVLGFLVLATFCAGQQDPDLEMPSPSGPIEKLARFGTPASDRVAAYEKRLELEKRSEFGGIKWRPIGPTAQGGRVVEIAAPESDPSKLYVAFATGGFWRTEDDGITWQSLFDHESAFGLGSFALSKDGKTIWLGTGEANSQRTSYAGTGVFKSVDAGKTWTNMGLPDSHHIAKILIDPVHPDTVYVAAMGHLYSQNDERGVFKTEDGGKNWSQVLKVDNFTGAIDLIMDRKNPRVLVASMWDRDRRAWDFRENGAGSAAYRTSDGGKNWSKINDLPLALDAGRIGLASSWSNPEIMYALVDNQGLDPDWADEDEKVVSGKLTPRRIYNLTDAALQDLDLKLLKDFLKDRLPSDQKPDDVVTQIKDKKLDVKGLKELLKKKNDKIFTAPVLHAQVFKSKDAGKTWKKVEVSNLGEFGGYYWGRIFVHPQNPDEIFVTGVPMLRSLNGGKSWASIVKGIHVDYHAVWVDARDPKKIWVGNDGGLAVTNDDGEHARHIENLPVGQATTLAIDNESPYNVIIGLQDNGTIKGSSDSTVEHGNWTNLYGGDGSAIAIDPRGDRTYVAYQFGEHFAIEKSGGTRYVRPAAPAGDPAIRFNWISPIILSPFQPDIVYVGAQRLYRSFDQGRSYKPISPDLSKNRPQGNVPFATIKEISESPLRFGLIYAGCDDGSLKMTPDGGFQWIDIATPEPDKWVSRVVASKWDVATVYVTQNGYRDDDFRPYVWRSTDYGKTWKSISANLPLEPVNVIREDPKNKDILYLGTDMGVYVSTDGGLSWEPLPGEIPHVPVHDLAVSERAQELVAATHARSVWILSLNDLYRVTSEVRSKPLTLFKVDDVNISRTWGYENQPKYDVDGPKPPLLKGTFYTQKLGAATVKILDKDNKVIASTSFDALTGINAFELSLRLTEPKPIKITKHLIKTGKEAVADPYLGNRATFVPAGDYRLEIQVGTEKTSQPWSLKASVFEN